MRKQLFCLLTCVISSLNGVTFYLDTEAALKRGIPGVDNQAALMVIPLLWNVAPIVLAVLIGYTLACGSGLGKDYRFYPRHLFHMEELKGWKLAGRTALILGSILVALCAVCVNVPKGELISAAYLLTGVLFLICLYLWQQAEVERHVG